METFYKRKPPSPSEESSTHRALDECRSIKLGPSLVILNMDETYITYKKSKRNLPKVSNLHRFQVQVFYEVIDRQLQELNNRFTEVSTELLLCIACLSLTLIFIRLSFVASAETVINIGLDDLKIWG